MVHDGCGGLLVVTGHPLVGLANGAEEGADGILAELRLGSSLSAADCPRVELSDHRELVLIEHGDLASTSPAVKGLHERECTAPARAAAALPESIGVVTVAHDMSARPVTSSDLDLDREAVRLDTGKTKHAQIRVA